MKEWTAQVPTADGTMETFVTHPEQDGPFPPVVVFMDIWGVREELRDIARRIAAVGYCCLLPNLYYRQGGVSTAFHDDAGRMISLHNLDEARKKRVFEPRDQLSDDMIVADIGALLRFIDGQDQARPGAVGSIGYCLGGWSVFAAAGHYPDRFQAGASLHGTYMVTDQPDSPHLLAGRFRGEIYCGMGEHDPFTPPDVVAALDEALGPATVGYRREVHPGAEHGYALPDRDVFDKRAAERDWELIFAMFHRQIPPYAG